MGYRKLVWLPIVVSLLSTACGPSGPSRSSPADSAQNAGTRPSATLAILVKKEPVAIAFGGAGGVSQDQVKSALFTAGLARTDGREAPYPVLAESLPRLNTDTWQVFPDGRMQTTYRLRPGLVWHDGQPLTAEDFAFGNRVRVAAGEWGLENPSTEARQIEEILASDPRTLVVRWKQIYVEAETPGLSPHPQHILAGPLQQGIPEAFASLPHWTTEYVGLGPYRLERWEQGAFIEGSAFERYALGRPRIDRVRLTWSGDPNVALTGLLSGQVQMVADTAVQFQQAATLRRQWTAGQEGVIILSPNQVRYQMIQSRSYIVDPAALLDVRVRRAMYHAVDRKALADAMLEGEGIVADSFIPPTAGFFSELDRVVRKYAYDPRLTEQMMAEAGFTRGSDGLFVSPVHGRFAPALWGLADGQEAQETTAVADFYRRAGIDVRLELLPQARYTQDRDFVLNQFPSIRNTYASFGTDSGMNKFASPLIASAETRWQGQNRIGYANAEFDRFYDAFWTNLDRDQRNQAMIQMARVLAEDLPSLPFYFNVGVVAHSASLQGPKPVAPTTSEYWDIHEWSRR